MGGLLYWKMGHEMPYYAGALLMLLPILLIARLPTHSPPDQSPTINKQFTHIVGADVEPITIH